MVRRWAKTTARVAGASLPTMLASHSRMWPGLIDASCREPKNGSRCLRTRNSVLSRVDSSNERVRSQFSAYSAKVIRPAFGST